MLFESSRPSVNSSESEKSAMDFLIIWWLYISSSFLDFGWSLESSDSPLSSVISACWRVDLFYAAFSATVTLLFAAVRGWQ